MFAVSTYEEVIEREKLIKEKELVVFLFVRPGSSNYENVIQEFEYLHYNSSKSCSIYAIGYTDDFNKKDEDDSYHKVINYYLNSDWYYSPKKFAEFKNYLKDRIHWKYSGEIEVLVLQNNPNSSDPLDFRNYVAIDINYGIRKEYISSFQSFMESIVQNACDNIGHIFENGKSRISVKEVLSNTLYDSSFKNTDIQKIINDRYFYKTPKNYD